MDQMFCHRPCIPQSAARCVKSLLSRHVQQELVQFVCKRKGTRRGQTRVQLSTYTRSFFLYSFTKCTIKNPKNKHGKIKHQKTIININGLNTHHHEITTNPHSLSINSTTNTTLHNPIFIFLPRNS